MTRTDFGSLLTAAATMAIANLLLSSGIRRVQHFTISVSGLAGAAQEPRIWVGLAISGLAAILWLHILNRGPLTVAYPVFVALTYVLLAVAAPWILGEHVPISRLGGVALIVGGIALVAWR